MALGLAGAAVAAAQSAAPASERAPRPARTAGHVSHRAAHAVRPQAFSSCASLIRYGRRYLGLTHGVPETPVQPIDGPVSGASTGRGTGAPTAQGAPAPAGATAPATGASPSTGYSTTNNQEPGVDEPDTVKTDGSTIFAVSAGKLYAVSVAGGGPRIAGSLDLGGAGYGAQLLLRGKHLIVISGAASAGPVGVAVGQGAPAAGAGSSAPSSTASTGPGAIAPASAPTPGRPGGAGGGGLVSPSPYYYGAQTTLSEVDASDPTAMKVIRTITIDGSFVDARESGGTARIVISSAPRAIAYPALRGQASGYVPSWRFHSMLTGRRYTRPVAGCRHVAHPAAFSGLGMVTIFTLDLDRGLWTAGTDALMADAQVVYGSQRSLYIATEKWIDPATPADQLPSQQTTQIDRFDATSPDSTPFVASGEVPGYLLNQFSLSESDGYLRVASTSRPDWWGGTVPDVPSQSYLTVLATSGNRLAPVGRLSGLGTGQKIYSVRFVGDVAYVVTFRQVDPLYTIDLADPTAPRIAGQLELEGYSSYLHPIAGGLLLGVGQDVGAGNEPSGSQLELFDVADPSSPKLVQKTTLGAGSSTAVQYDHHAFLFWPPTGLAVLPVQIYPAYNGGPATPGTPAQPAQSSNPGFTGAIGFHIDRSGIREAGRISHPTTSGYAPAIGRALVIGDQLYTVSDEGVLASTLGTLAPGAFAAFPSATAPPPGGPPSPAAQ